jgi:hypothetical protein
MTLAPDRRRVPAAASARGRAPASLNMLEISTRPFDLLSALNATAWNLM